MKRRSEPQESTDALRDKIIGLGERSIRKSYYPQLEQRLAELERFKALLDQSTDAILLIDTTSGLLVDVNLTACHYLGYPTNETLVGRPLREVLPPDITAQLRDLRAFQQPLESAGQTHTITFQKPGGATLSIEITMKPVTFGETLYTVAVARDITKRREMEAALEEDRALLTRRVAERTADLSAANAELAQALQAKDGFLASMSHELRTPLSAILTITEVLQTGLYGDLTQRQQQAMQDIKESGEHLLGLINDILDLSKITAGKFELDIAPVDLLLVCQTSLQLTREATTQKHLNVSFSFDPAVDYIYADGRRLKQSLINLISNAIKFTPPGGSIGLEVQGDLTEDTIRLTVWDTGIGIAEENFLRVFQPFVQLDNSLTRQYEGTGLGLALVYRIIEHHGGSIVLESEPNQGSRFILSLPWHKPHLDHTAEVPPETATGPLLLIAERNESNLTALTETLLAQGYQIAAAQSGLEILQEVAEQHPALLIMNAHLPEMDGVEIIRRIRRDPTLTSLPIIVLTALGIPGEREHFLEAGANAYLLRPVSPSRLIQILQEHLRKF
ncbi:MAG: ATP-binding protein [Anaerolineae bacterium]|jgi:PAS domain S-box-containing protein|nr:ATP-binding protein [Anaerolineae bacterium]